MYTFSMIAIHITCSVSMNPERSILRFEMLNFNCHFADQYIESHFETQ